MLRHFLIFLPHAIVILLLGCGHPSWGIPNQDKKKKAGETSSSKDIVKIEGRLIKVARVRHTDYFCFWVQRQGHARVEWLCREPPTNVNKEEFRAFLGWFESFSTNQEGKFTQEVWAIFFCKRVESWTNGILLGWQYEPLSGAMLDPLSDRMLKVDLEHGDSVWADISRSLLDQVTPKNILEVAEGASSLSLPFPIP